jgi:hypothetical protein
VTVVTGVGFRHLVMGMWVGPFLMDEPALEGHFYCINTTSTQ